MNVTVVNGNWLLQKIILKQTVCVGDCAVRWGGCPGGGGDEPHIEKYEVELRAHKGNTMRCQPHFSSAKNYDQTPPTNEATESIVGLYPLNHDRWNGIF